MSIGGAAMVSPFRRVPIPGGQRFTFDVRAERGLRHRKRAVFGRFTIDCDEGPALGGEDTAPPPLAYFSAALAF
jgi:hypothetical protein